MYCTGKQASSTVLVGGGTPKCETNLQIDVEVLRGEVERPRAGHPVLRQIDQLVRSVLEEGGAEVVTVRAGKARARDLDLGSGVAGKGRRRQSGRPTVVTRRLRMASPSPCLAAERSSSIMVRNLSSGALRPLNPDLLLFSSWDL